MSRLLRVIVPVLVTCLLLVLGEFAFRSLLFSSVSWMQPLRRPGLYAAEFSEDYFKLAFRFLGAYVQPNDRLLGWVNHKVVEPGTYRHVDEAQAQDRQPVLLYGDSFAQCATPREQCFDGILNGYPAFNAKYYLLNYGINGYGLDQISLLCRQTVGRFKNPVVIVSLLDEDLDRSMVSASWQTKPYFTLNGGQLVYHNGHMDPDIRRYSASHPPDIDSYLVSLARYGLPLPEPVASIIQGAEARRTRIKELNRAIILQTASDLKARNLRHVFLVFETAPKLCKPPGWRILFLKDVFKEAGIEHIFARDLFCAQGTRETLDYRQYVIDEGNHHPNVIYNTVVCRKILGWLEGAR